MTVGFAAILLIAPVRATFEYFELNAQHKGSISTFILLSRNGLILSMPLVWVTGATAALLAQEEFFVIGKIREGSSFRMPIIRDAPTAAL